MRALALSTALLAGCYRPVPQAGSPCSDQGTCPDPLACIDGTCQPADTMPIDAAIDACPEASCLGDDLAGCGSRITCALGCADAVATTPAHCRIMTPSNGIPLALLEGATGDLSGLDVELDTETGEITMNGGDPVRPPGPGVIGGIGFYIVDGMGIFVANSITVSPLGSDSANDWDLSGDNSFVLFSATTIRVEGMIDAGASGSGPGPGGISGATSGSVGTGCRGRAGLWQSAGFGEGGGGGGGRTAGGNGAVSNTTTFGVGGVSCSSNPTTIPLRGGNGGGAGGVETAASPDVVHGGFGGGGGGGVALVAMESIEIGTMGVVCAAGGGGLTGTTGDGGGGGGGGGAVLLESPVVSVMPGGAVTANGGGGAAPTMTNGSRGHCGDASTASGGTFMTAGGGRGGTGTSSPGAGTNFTDGTTARGGGGGGAAGRTEIRARARSTTGAIVSPGAALTDIATQ